MNKRVEWIDIAKFIGIFFVMLSHFEVCPSFLRVFFTPFYLAIFFFCSGYCYRQKETFDDFLKKKIRQLVVPWFIYSNLNIILSNIKSFKKHENGFLTEVFRNLLQIRYFDERLWFIPALFTAFIPFYFVIRAYQKDKNSKKLLILCAILSFIRQLYKEFMDPDLLPWKLTSLPWHIDYIPTAMLFMVLGYLFKEEWEKAFDEKVDTTKQILILFIYLFVVYLAYFLDFSLSMIPDFFYDHIRHFLGIVVIICVSKKIPANQYNLYVGQNTLIYFCLHNKAVTLIEVITRRLLPQLNDHLFNNGLMAALYCFVFTFAVSLILIIPAEIINRYLPWTIGKGK